jgi:hypothetical protein
VDGVDRDRSAPEVRAIEAALLGRLRSIAIVVILVCIFLTAAIDPLGRLFVDPSFHASEVFLGTLVGALVVLLGLQTLPRFPRP